MDAGGPLARAAEMDADGEPGLPWEAVVKQVREGASARRRG